MNDQIELGDFAKQRICAEFKDRRRRIVQATWLGTALVILVLVSPDSFGVDPRAGRAALMLVVFTMALWINLRVWRCPHCGGHLGKLYFGLAGPYYCRQCGVQLAERGPSGGR